MVLATQSSQPGKARMEDRSNGSDVLNIKPTSLFEAGFFYVTYITESDYCHDLIFRRGWMQKLTLIFLSVLFLLVLRASPASADTNVGGAITVDTTWTLAGSPYNVSSTVQVYGTSTTPTTLTIEPGVVVKFASGAALQIGNGTSQGEQQQTGLPLPAAQQAVPGRASLTTTEP